MAAIKFSQEKREILSVCSGSFHNIKLNCGSRKSVWLRSYKHAIEQFIMYCITMILKPDLNVQNVRNMHFAQCANNVYIRWCFQVI